jgi:hypothetical protein
MKLSVVFFDREVVDASEPAAHQPIVGELPIFISVRSEPTARIIVPFVGEPNRDSILGKSPQLLDEPVVQLLYPLAGQKRDDCGSTMNEFRPVTPSAVQRISQ